jgi:hypothetical protein
MSRIQVNRMPSWAKPERRSIGAEKTPLRLWCEELAKNDNQPEGMGIYWFEIVRGGKPGKATFLALHSIAPSHLLTSFADKHGYLKAKATK